MKRKNLIMCCFFIFSFIIIMSLVSFNLTDYFDNLVYNFIISFRCSFLDVFFKFITKFGDTITIFIIIFLFFVFFHNKHSLLLSFIAIITSSFMLIIKNLIKRIRPDILRIIQIGGYSFPSGHSMISVCVYGYIIYYIFTNFKNKFLKYFILITLLILILMIGISRIYLGVHYPSDVLGGYLISGSILIIIIEMSKKIERKK